MNDIDKAINQEILKRLKVKMREVNRKVREYAGQDIEHSVEFRELISEQLSLKSRIKALE